MAWLRSVLAVVSGLATAFVLVMALTAAAVWVFFGGDFAAPPTAPYLALNLAYTGLAAVLGGWVAGTVAGRFPLGHAAAVAVVMLLPAAFGGDGGGGAAAAGVPGWYGSSLLVIGPGGALLGGFIRRLQRSRDVDPGSSTEGGSS